MASITEDRDLGAAIKSAINTYPDLRPLFRRIDNHFATLQLEIQSLQGAAVTAAEPASKKRKVEDTIKNGAVLPERGAASSVSWLRKVWNTQLADVSVTAPARKKMRLEIVADADGGIRAVDQKTELVEGGLRWSDIDQIISVPVPEKAQPAHHFLLIPRTVSQNSLVFTVPDTNYQKVSFNGPPPPVANEHHAYPAFLSAYLQSLGQEVTQPSASEFLSSLTQHHRSAEKPAHVKAFRGSKDGFLYFLGPGILFGFRKPVLWFPFDRISSVSYTSVLQRTFNMVIVAQGVEDGKGPDDEIEYEFSMIDQIDFAGIDAYVKNHGLQDQSLAAQRKAKRYGVNDARVKAVSGETVKAEDDADEKPSDLAQAEQQIQDEEDEEEDYDPGSEGESEGEGSDSEEDEAMGMAEGVEEEFEEADEEG